jgi:hypothetical protein
MNHRTLAISILQKARDTLSERLTQRIVDSQQDIEDDAEGCSYLSEIETIYEQLGGRLAHLNAMLANLPAATGPSPADTAASEVIYADMASAYPTGLEIEAATPLTLLALPAPSGFSQQQHVGLPGDSFQDIAVHVQAGDLGTASRLISELFDIKPSQARRGAQAFSRRSAADPDLARRIVELGDLLPETSEQSGAALLSECFEFPPFEAAAIVQTLKLRLTENDNTPRS